MAFFIEGIAVLKTLVTAIGVGLGAWGVINLMGDMERITQEQNPRGSNNLWLIRDGKTGNKQEEFE